MKRVLLSSIITGLLLASASAYAGMVCYSTNARGVGPWSWQSCNPNPSVAQSIASQGAINECSASPNTFNPGTCRITSCAPVACAYTPDPGSVVTCTAIGKYGHQWMGTGPDVSSALNNALYTCQSGGGINCQVSPGNCSSQ